MDESNQQVVASNPVEQRVFDKLAALTASVGYAHAIAAISLRENILSYANQMSASDMVASYSNEKVLRNELTTLVGLMVKKPIDCANPDEETLNQYISQTDSLLREMHTAITRDAFSGLFNRQASEKPFWSAKELREPIFYGGESAYHFQYLDFSVTKYSADDAWLQTNKGFTSQNARDVIKSIGDVYERKLVESANATSATPTYSDLLLHAFTTAELADCSGVDQAIVCRVIEAFTLPPGEMNIAFRSLHDFNQVTAFPLLRMNDQRYLAFQTYTLVEALYEAPFYWMASDTAYRSEAMKNRGRFTEALAEDRLTYVFGIHNVFSNVNILDARGERLTEIDVLVVFANRAIVVQAKSKRLTLEARKGNDKQLKDDFRKSVQSAYDQAYQSAALLEDVNARLVREDSSELAIARNFSEIYLLCVVSDHYPALAFQAREFLRYKTTDAIRAPLVLDVFALDAMAEMLSSPLRFLSYLNRRVHYADLVMAMHELTILSFHLKHNLSFGSKYDHITLGDDIAADLDIAMMVRRTGVSGDRTPEGILTWFSGTTLGGILSDIEEAANPATIGLGFLLLSLDESTIGYWNRGIDLCITRTRRDGQVHDVCLALDSGRTGLVVHCSMEPMVVAQPWLARHCNARKYAAKASAWYGVCVDPENSRLRFAIALDYPWEHEQTTADATASLRKLEPAAEALAKAMAAKVGRNDSCPCGSGRKYKKCCGKP